jgi:hypothetical protein
MNIALYQLADQYLQILEKTDEAENDDAFNLILDSLSSDIKEKAYFINKMKYLCLILFLICFSFSKSISSKDYF